MVVGAFPVAKLGALLLKQVSKPLANIVKARAKTNPFFRTYICMPPAQFYHWAEVKMKMWSMNLGKPVNIPKLNEAMAIDLGAELLGEGIIFVIAAAILIAEYIRSSKKEKAKEEALTAELNLVQNDLRNLYMQTANQESHIKELVRILNVSLPEAKYAPKPYDAATIPEHHREEHQEEEDATMLSNIKGWVWSAIDFILPDVDDSARHPDESAPLKNNTVTVYPSNNKPSPSASLSSNNNINSKTSASSSVNSNKNSASSSSSPNKSMPTGPMDLANPSSIQDKMSVEKR